jgi:predicted acylesterase/phospholipase RssA
MSQRLESEKLNPLDAYHSIGIILSGGGAKGAYQAGALKAIHQFLTLHDAHHKVRMIAGTSIGSWNALFWLAGLVEHTDTHRDSLEQWWSNLSVSALVSPVFYLPGTRNYFLSQSPWTRSFERLFVSDDIAAKKLEGQILDPLGDSIHFYLTRSNVERARLEVTTNRDNLKGVQANLPTRGWASRIQRVHSHRAKNLDDLRTAVFSSMDLPPLFQYTKIGDGFYEDGGVIDNLPIQFGTESEHCDLLLILPLNATFAREVDHSSIIRRLLRVMDVRQGVLERNSLKMVYLYNELAALRQRTEELEILASRAKLALSEIPDPRLTDLIAELDRELPSLVGKPAEEAALADRALMRRHRRVQVFAICPAPKLAVNTIDFWKRSELGKAFRLMHQATLTELDTFFAQPPEYIRMALVQPTGDVQYMEEF